MRKREGREGGGRVGGEEKRRGGRGGVRERKCGGGGRVRERGRRWEKEREKERE